MKKKLKRYTGIATAALMLVFPIRLEAAGDSATTPLTLEETIRLVREHNPALKAAAEEVNAAEARIRQQKSAYFPQITASAGYRYIDPVSEMSFGGGDPIQFMPNDNYEAKVTAKATLLDFGKRGNQVDIARSGKNAAGHSFEIARRDISYRTVELFYGILFLRESIRVEEKEITALRKAFDYTSKRYQAGTATRFDVLSTDVRIQAARSKKLGLEHQLRRHELTLRRLTGVAANTPLNLKGSFSVHSARPDAPSLVESAVRQRPELKLAGEYEQSARLRRSLTMKEGLPIVSASASWGVTNGYQPDIDEIRENVAAGIHVELPIFTGFRTSAERQEAAALLRAASQQRLDTEEQVKTDVEETLHALETAREKILTTESQVQQAKLAAEHARARYENGMATTLDLLDTEASLAQAELARLQAAYDYVLNNYTLKRATGEVFW
ncbi:MAG: TolC family protein [Chlorobium sp.]|nr:TolC family protein [Chlorobium sp.]MCF8382285.1 TolC family protein [Chlorobium sp.]